MNKAILIGNLTKEPELRTTPAGVSVTSFTLAVTRRFKDKEGNKITDFLPIVVWGKTAESCANYLVKGSRVSVLGEIQTRSYDAKDGTKRYVTEIVASEVEFLHTKNKDQAAAEPMPDELADAGFGEIKDEDMPF